MRASNYLKWWINAQFVYACLGIAFNLVSIAVAISTGATLTQTNPWLGIAMMALVAGAARIGRSQHFKTFVICNLVLLVPLIHSGVLKHASTLSTLDFSQAIGSPLFYALLINVFGVVVLATSLAFALRSILKH